MTRTIVPVFARPGTLRRSLDIELRINYTLPDAWFLTGGPIISANRQADSGDRWTVPFGVVLGKSSRSAVNR